MPENKGPLGQGKSPWMDKGKPMKPEDQEALDEEIYAQAMSDTDERVLDNLDRARLASEKIPQQSNWPTCWACGAKVPMLIRDPVDGTLVCKTCACYSTVRRLGRTLFHLVHDMADMLLAKVGIEPPSMSREGRQDEELKEWGVRPDAYEDEDETEDETEEEPEGDEPEEGEEPEDSAEPKNPSEGGLQDKNKASDDKPEKPDKAGA